MCEPSLKVLVAGGGIGGLTFAAAAKLAGLSPVVIERSSEVKRSSAGGGLAIWPPSQEVMHRLGVLPRLEQEGAYMAEPGYFDRAGRRLARPSPYFGQRFPILCFERDALVAALADRCVELGVEFRTGVEIEGFTETASGVDVTVGSGAAVATDVLVGADGIHSGVRNTMLRKMALPEKHASPCGYAYFRAVVSTEGCDPSVPWADSSFESWGDGCRFGYVPLKPPHIFWFAAVPFKPGVLEPRAGTALATDEQVAWLREKFAAWDAPVGLQELLCETPPSAVLRTDIQKIEGVAGFPWRSETGRVVLVGDAAHATAPNLAQGAGLSIEDAAHLAAALGDVPHTLPAARSDALRAAAAAYEKARRPRAATVQRMADLVATVGQSTGAPAAIRDGCMAAATQHLPDASAWVFESAVSHSLGGGGSQLHWLPPPAVPTASPAREETCLLADCLGRDAFASLPQAVRGFRASATGGAGEGVVTVRRGSGLVARVLGAAAGLPRAMEGMRFTASVRPHGADGREQLWTRVFGAGEAGAARYATVHRSVPWLSSGGCETGRVLTESLGLRPDLLRFGYSVVRTEAGIAYTSVGLWLRNTRVWVPDALRSLLLPSSTWREAPLPQGWTFDGDIHLPRLLGGSLLMHYHGEFAPTPTAQRDGRRGRAIVAGGTGMIGEALCEELEQEGWEVVVLSRTAPSSLAFSARRVVQWDARTGEGWAHLIDARTVLVNLAGENPGKRRWTAGTKAAIVDSRMAAVEGLSDGLRQASAAGAKPRMWVQMSAAGVYGDRGEEELTEASLPGLQGDFRSLCCQQLERESGKQAAAADVPLVTMRMGHVLSSAGGLFPSVELGSLCRTARLGSGRQFVPWVHVEDAARAVAFACRSRPEGAQTYNVAAPEAARNEELFATLATVRQRTLAWAAVPAWMVRLLFGESSSVVLDSERVVPAKLQEEGFTWKYPSLQSALCSEACL